MAFLSTKSLNPQSSMLLQKMGRTLWAPQTCQRILAMWLVWRTASCMCTTMLQLLTSISPRTYLIQTTTPSLMTWTSSSRWLLRAQRESVLKHLLNFHSLNVMKTIISLQLEVTESASHQMLSNKTMSCKEDKCQPMLNTWGFSMGWHAKNPTSVMFYLMYFYSDLFLCKSFDQKCCYCCYLHLLTIYTNSLLLSPINRV